MKQRKTTRLQLTTLAACIALLLISLCLPLVALMSYRWGLGEVLAKLPRLVHSGTAQAVGYVLLAVMVLSPLLLGLRSWFSSRPLWAERLLPAAGSLLLVAALLPGSKPVAPAVGLWLYLAAALLLAVLPALMHRKE